MPNSVLQVPEQISFQEAITVTQTLLTQMEEDNLSESDVKSVVSALVASSNGARGFFVTYLTDERSVANQASDAVADALTSSPNIVPDLLVKNLAMSAAMAVAHRRNQDENMAASSDRVQQRTAWLICRLSLPEIRTLLNHLQESVETGTGDYQAFLTRWNYDAEQRQAIRRAIEAASTCY